MGGILLGYLTSYLFVDDVAGWRLMYGLAAGPAVVLLAGMVRCCPTGTPASPMETAARRLHMTASPRSRMRCGVTACYRLPVGCAS